MSVFSYTNKGQRFKNEDYLLSERLSPDISFHIVADGMGGYNYGENAAMIVAETIADQIRISDFFVITEEDIIHACKKANQKLTEEGLKLSSKLGATFVAALIMKDTLLAFWMGDSRIYQYNEEGKNIFRSTDHSLVNELRLSRILSTSEIQKFNSIVTRSLSSQQMEILPQIEVLSYSQKDTIILCSDGLYKQIDPVQIIDMPANYLLSYLNSMEEEVEDNYSIIVIK